MNVSPRILIIDIHVLLYRHAKIHVEAIRVFAMMDTKVMEKHLVSTSMNVQKESTNAKSYRRLAMISREILASMNVHAKLVLKKIQIIYSLALQNPGPVGVHGLIAQEHVAVGEDQEIEHVLPTFVRENRQNLCRVIRMCVIRNGLHGQDLVPAPSKSLRYTLTLKMFWTGYK